MKFKIFLIAFVAFILAGISCTKLDETLRGTLEEASSSVTAAGLLKNAYLSLNGPIQDGGGYWGLGEITADGAIAPTRGPDWDDNGAWRALVAHTWDADQVNITGTFTGLLTSQFAASSVLEKSPSAQEAAEARFIRAFSVFLVLDGWGQVPIRLDLQNLTQLPETLDAQGAIDFITSELNAVINDLPDGPVIKGTKDAARVLLMKLYLNKGAYLNRASPTFDAADMNQVITLADQIINSGKYDFPNDYFDTFAPDNYSNPTKVKNIIYALENTNGVTGGNGAMYFWYAVNHYNQNPSGWNGYATLSDYYDKYEPGDKRLEESYPGVTDVSGIKVGYMIGQQYDENGTALKDRNGKPLSFTREVHLRENDPNTLEVTGIRPMKYPIDYVKQFPSENEYVVFRYSDVLLMKAEALLRSGGDADEAKNLVNSIRAKVNASQLSSVSLTDVYDERGRELYWEGWRRNDMIRFGTFLNAWQEKDASDPRCLLFPIPNNQLAVNPNLTQNPGYN